MADFTVENLGPPLSGLQLEPWLDPPTSTFPLPETPSRINPLPGLSHTFWVLRNTIAKIIIACRVNGVLSPPDTSLGGRLFTWAWVDRPYEPMPPIVPAVGFSSTVEFAAGTFGSGHFTLQALRPSGGAVGFSFDVILP